MVGSLTRLVDVRENKREARTMLEGFVIGVIIAYPIGTIISPFLGDLIACAIVRLRGEG
jgi:uncharacterized protein YqgC (DUF456 family)